MFASVLIGIIAATAVVGAVPSPNALGSDLTILINNDILGTSHLFHMQAWLTWLSDRTTKPLG